MTGSEGPFAFTLVGVLTISLVFAVIEVVVTRLLFAVIAMLYNASAPRPAGCR